MKKKKLLVIGILCTILLLITGCATNKTALTTSQFTSKIEEYNLEINNMTDNISGENGEMNNTIKEAIYATSKDGWTVEFYVLKDNKSANDTFTSTKKLFEAFEENMTSRTSVNIGNYNTYTLTTKESYMHVCRVDNTVLVINTDIKNKETAKELVDKLGY